ncbi:MAG: deoxyribonuclease IV [Spirochaetota bacterium]
MLLLGCHASIAGGYHRAIERGSELSCTALQIFTRNQLQWKSKPVEKRDIELFREARERHQELRIVFAHGSYLLNLATQDRELRKNSLILLKEELQRCSLLSLPYLIIHPGSHGGAGERDGVGNVISCLMEIGETFKKGTMICIETTSGQGTGIGCCFEHLRDIVRSFPEGNVGVCIDTCHIFAAGYDLRNRKTYEAMVENFDRIVGLERLKVLHLNDSKGELGSRIDRHEHIGKGRIGKNAFAYIMQDVRFKVVPKIIETPKTGKGDEMDNANLNLLRSLAGEEAL